MHPNDRKPGFFARLGHGLTLVRVILSNLLFFGLLAILLIVLFSGAPTVEVPDGGALVINPEGTIVEQRSTMDPIQQWLSPQAVMAETELSELLDALDHAREDERIGAVVLDLDDLQYVSTVHAAALGDALSRFREGGKQVIAYGSYFAQQPYLIATHADAVYMHPLGQIMLPGFSVNQIYFKGLLDKLDINVHVFRAGRYKEFVEPYIRSDMSEDAREANSELVASLWQAFAQRVTDNRHLDDQRFARYAHAYDAAVEETDGDFAQLAVEYQLVDELLTPDQARVRIADTVGFDNDGDFRGIGFADYLQAFDDESATATGKPQVAVITAEGPIMMGDHVRGGIGAQELIGLIRQVRNDETMRALVLRLDTPGGSAFASELIRQELELLQLSDKPVVISMGPVAASGGYWVASTADAIFAEPTTLTGSIGVFGIMPTFEESLAGIGVATDGVTTSELTMADPLRGLSERAASVLQTGTDHTYRRFTNLVARGRGLTPEQVEAIAQGRVWLGGRAQELGLVDTLGDLSAAVDQAAELADLDDYQTRRIRPPLSARDVLLQRLAGNLSRVPGLAGVVGPYLQDEPGLVLPPVVRELGEAWRWLASLNDPRHSYALCLVCTTPGR